jgi:hypothetical protein
VGADRHGADGADRRHPRRDARGLAHRPSLSTFAIASTATPEYVSGVLFIALLASSTVGFRRFLANGG